ncbi:hypothetical protein Pla22_50370 [Rubripirellula amarantea]|uniref:Secreted protein n=1 Tax=Rubripirellula amarantea TaxID=2527999 RepID=A0A5C5WC05_9BACT|nr:ATP synthase F0 subunit B [Rubripirellula amarantea]TWT48037.1 hypothetical protein Pla22_50370 [Rubripirellula amarantea]
MRLLSITLLSCLAIAGCQGEPTTLREEAELAQENLDDARQRAAELVAESEADAVEIVADARDAAEERILDAKRDANVIVADAQEELTEKLDELSEKRVVEPVPVDDSDQSPPPATSPK